MARYKTYDYSQMQMVPVSLETQLAPGTLEYAIHHVIEKRVDTSEFDKKYRNDETGRSAYSPKVLFKVILFGYSRGMMSSRRLEQACRENITFMALACGQAPDHTTLATFISSMGEERIASLFAQVLLVCDDEGLLGGTHFSLDGLKVSSNASKEWSGTHKELAKKKEKLEKKVKEAIREHREEDQRGGDRDGERQKRRIERLERAVEKIDQFLKDNKPKIGRQGEEIQSNVTDNESAKLTGSHGVQQGYNANALVDQKHQVVVHAEAFGETQDSTSMKPMLEGGEKNLKGTSLGNEPFQGKKVSADTGYYSVENLETCRDGEVDAYIPDRQFRKRDVRFADAERYRRPVDKHKERYESKRRWFGPEDFRWDDRTRRLICPAGEGLYLNGRDLTIDGYKVTSYRAPKRACRNCRLRAKCLRSSKTQQRQVYFFHGKRRPGSLTDEMKEKIDTPEGRRIYGQRLAIVEPVFGNIRAQKGLDRFTLRGRGKIDIQWMLYCLVHNIEKIVHFGRSYAMAT